MDWQNMLFSANGRIRRRDYWVWGVVIFVGYIFACLIAGIVLGLAGVIREGDEVMPNIVAAVLAIPYIWSNVCLVAKRWHDRDKSGWMYLIQLIPLVGGIWQLVECGFLDGTQGPNRYGPSPKGIGDQTRVF